LFFHGAVVLKNLPTRKAVSRDIGTLYIYGGSEIARGNTQGFISFFFGYTQYQIGLFVCRSIKGQCI
jgi:hypothetical protein